jgi:hypothetical protein
MLGTLRTRWSQLIDPRSLTTRATACGARTELWTPIGETDQVSRQRCMRLAHVRLCQTSWCDPAVRSHVGSLGGAVWLTVLALQALRLHAVCHPEGQDSGRENLGISNDE